MARRFTSSLLCVLCVFCGSFCPPLRADEFSQTSRYSVRLFSGGTLTVDARTGDIHIEGWDDPRVEVEAEKVVRAKSEAEANRLYDQIGIQFTGQDKEVRLSTFYPGRSLWRPFHGESKLSVNFRIQMPYDANLTLRCVDGDVRVFGVTGREKLSVNYGDVEINVPDVWRLRSFDAHAWVGYVQSDLHGMSQDSAGLQQRVSFWNSYGSQDIVVRVRMGGVWVYSN